MRPLDFVLTRLHTNMTPSKVLEDFHFPSGHILLLFVCVCLWMNVPVCVDVQTLEELSLCVLSRLEEVVKEKHHWREITEAHVQLLRDFAFQEWLCSQSLEHYYHTWVLFSKLQKRSIHQPSIRSISGLFIINSPVYADFAVFFFMVITGIFVSQ